VHPLCLSRDDPRVGLGNTQLVVWHVLLVHGDPLLLVVGASVADDDLGGVLVGHDDGGLREPVPEAEGVVGFEGLLEHAGVEVLLVGESGAGVRGGLTERGSWFRRSAWPARTSSGSSSPSSPAETAPQRLSHPSSRCASTFALESVGSRAPTPASSSP